MTKANQYIHSQVAVYSLPPKADQMANNISSTNFDSCLEFMNSNKDLQDHLNSGVIVDNRLHLMDCLSVFCSRDRLSLQSKLRMSDGLTL
jgi:hypothetical protein